MLTAYLHSQDIEEPNRIQKEIKQVILHPRYKHPLAYYDIAVVEMETIVEFTKFIHPVCLPYPEENRNRFGTAGNVVGYGTNTFVSNKYQLTHLRFDVYHMEYCNQTHLTQYVLF